MPDSSPQIVLVEHAGEHISVSVEFRDRDRLSISVHPDGSVTALAPAGRTLEEVLTHLNRRRSWIARQRRHFEKYQPWPVKKRYVPGETHLYLGRQYRLRVRQSDDTFVRLVGRFFEVHVPTPKQPEPVAAAMRDWYQSHAESLFQERLRRCVQSAISLRLSLDVKLRVKPMERRWGSCSKAGTITLNTDLVKTPLHCIDYVIMHELCHLRIHDHSPAFFRMLGRCMPDWQRRKDRLESMVIR
jgi:predicted metal-dependent hydrolase